MATRDFFDNIADVGSEEDEEDFDDETGEVRPKKTNGANGIDDSSEEEDEDDDELLAQARHSQRQVNRAELLTETTGRCWLRRR
jgi:hypothetical protein